MSLRGRSLCREKGFVMVTVLILCSVLISCASAFTWFVRTQARSVAGGRRAVEVRSMAEALTKAVMEAVSMIGEHSDYDSPYQKWYQPMILPFGSDEGSLGIWAAQVTPLDDKIPLRSMFLPDGNTLRREMSDVWEKMWENLGHRELEQVVLDLMDKNNKPRVGSMEHDWYINRPIYDMSELLILSTDITPALLNAIEEYCTVYSDGKINLNVAPVHVMELLPGLDVGGLAQSVAEYRTENAIESLRDIQKIPGASARTSTQLTNIAAFKSRYFSIKIDCMNSETENVTSYSAVFDRTTKQIVRWEEA